MCVPTTGVAAGDECASTPSSNSALATNVWSHIAVAVDVASKQVYFYIDGVTAGTITNNGLKIGTAGASGGPLRFGNGFTCGCMAYVGLLSDVRLWWGWCRLNPTQPNPTQPVLKPRSLAALESIFVINSLT